MSVTGVHVPAARAQSVSWNGFSITLAVVVAAAVALHLLVLSEGPHWTSPLLAGEWLFNAVLAGCLLLFSLVLGRRLGGPLRLLAHQPLDDGLAMLGLGFGALSAGMLCVGLVQLYYRPLLLLGFALATVVLRRDLLYLLAYARQSIHAWRRAGLPTAPEGGQRLILALLAFTSLYVLLRSMLPLTDWDAVVYHLASVKLYLAHHGVFPLPDIPLANGPAAEEMLFLLGLATGTDGLGKVLNIGFAVLLCIAIYILGRRLSGRTAGWQAVLLFGSTFWMIAVLPLAIVDFASAFLLVAGVNDGVAWADRLSTAARRGVSHGRADPLLIRSGLLIGFAASTKLSMLVALPVAGATVIAIAFLYGGRAWAPRVRGAVRAGAVITVSAAIPLAPWFLKNWAYFGNPLYPYATVAVSNPSHGISIDTAPTLPAAHITWIFTSLGDFLWNHVGALSLALAVAIVLLRRPGQRFALLFLATGLVAWFLFVPYFDPPRYYLGLAALAQALSVSALYAILPLNRRANMLRSIGVFCYLITRTWPNVLIGLGVMQQSLIGQVARGDISRYDYLAGQVRGYVSAQWVNSHTPAGTVIATAGVLSGYYLDRPYLNDWYGTRLSRLEAGGASREMELTAWCKAGVHFVIFDRGDGNMGFDGINGVRPPMSFPWLRTPGLNARLRFSANGVDVLSVDPCSTLKRGGE